MSKISRPFLLLFAAAVLILQLFNTSIGQDFEARLTLDAERAVVHVEGRFLSEGYQLSQPLTFLSGYAGALLPPDRISNVKRDGHSWSYDVHLAPERGPAVTTHTSWLSQDGAVLMLDDILPQPTRRKSVLMGLRFPTGWEAFAFGVTHRQEGFYFEDTEKGVVIVGPAGWRTLHFGANSQLSLLLSGKWMFSDEEASESANEVFDAYEHVFGPHTLRGMILVLFKSPAGTAPDAWDADTRGSTITIISSDSAFRSRSLQRLHEQLRHEMFHLWIPEGVNLTGKYDWFYEGFALYQSLKVGVAVNRIRFDDYLDTLSRAYEIDKRIRTRDSLIDASKNRWTNDDNTVVYARGMLLAFLCDLALLNATKGKVSTDDIVRGVYSRHSGAAAPQDGNVAVIAILKSHKVLVPIVDGYVLGADAIDWSGLLRTAGLQAETGRGVTTLTVLAKPSGRQKRLLDKLGYNNWRKLSSK